LAVKGGREQQAKEAVAPSIESGSQSLRVVRIDEKQRRRPCAWAAIPVRQDPPGLAALSAVDPSFLRCAAMRDHSKESGCSHHSMVDSAGAQRKWHD